MRILYVFSHPDDESFGPARVMSKQRRQGHEVYQLTLTKGGATRQRFKYGYSIEEMGQVRYREMQDVAKVLDLTELKVLDLPDSGLDDMDPRKIGGAIMDEIERVRPQVVVTDAVHGISGFHDHLVTHAVVKHAFVELRDRVPYLKRLAFHTVTEESAQQIEYFHLSGSKPEQIDCVVKVDEIDLDNAHKALDCYVTYQETIENSGVKRIISSQAVFEIYQERHEPELSDLFEGIG